MSIRTTVPTKEMTLETSWVRLLLQHELDIVHVVGVAAHELAVGMGVEELERQGLHLPEELAADDVGRALREPYREPGLQIGSADADEVDGGEDG